MNANLDFDQLLYGVMLVCFGVVAHRISPVYGNATLITGITGGVLVALWGVLGLRGFRRRIWPVGTLLVLNIALLIQAAAAWIAVKDGAGASKPVAMILTLLLAFGIVQMINYLQESRTGE